MSLLAAHPRDKEVGAWRGVEVGAGCPIPGRRLWARDWPVCPRSGETPPPGRLWSPWPEFGAGSPAWCQPDRPPVTMMLWPRYVLSPSPCVSLCHVLCAGSPGRQGEGGVLFISAHEKLCLAAAHGVNSQGARFGWLRHLTAFGFPGVSLVALLTWVME